MLTPLDAELRIVFPLVTLGKLPLRRHLAGQQTLLQWRVSKQRNLVVAAILEHAVLFYLPVQNVIFFLCGFYLTVRFELFQVDVRHPNRTNLALIL